MTYKEPGKTSLTREQQKQLYLKHKAEHEHKLATDPAYRAQWERKLEQDKQVLLLNDNIEETSTREQQHQAYLKSKAEFERKLATDPAYRAQWEKENEEFQKIALLNDSIEE